MEKKVLILSARSFGDAIIANSVAETIGDSADYDVSVLTKKEYRKIFESNLKIKKCYYTSLPIPGNRGYNIFDLFLCMRILRNKHFDIGLDIIGDFRERMILKCINPQQILSLERVGDNPYNKLIRRGFGGWCKKIFVPENVLNVYEALNYLYREMGVKKRSIRTKKTNVRTIGIHPFASQKCRMWSWRNWSSLINILLEQKYSVVLFCTKREHTILQNNIPEYTKCNVVDGDLHVFFYYLKSCDVFIGLDSFAYHAANSFGIPAVMLNGANDYRIWKTPISEVVLGNEQCPFWPCYNKPLCQEYVCMQSIRIDDVIFAMNRLINNVNNKYD